MPAFSLASVNWKDRILTIARFRRDFLALEFFEPHGKLAVDAGFAMKRRSRGHRAACAGAGDHPDDGVPLPFLILHVFRPCARVRCLLPPLFPVSRMFSSPLPARVLKDSNESLRRGFTNPLRGGIGFEFFVAPGQYWWIGARVVSIPANEVSDLHSRAEQHG